MSRRLGPALLAVGLQGIWGCAEKGGGNESEFSKYPGQTPPEARANSEEVPSLPAPAPKKAR